MLLANIFRYHRMYSLCRMKRKTEWHTKILVINMEKPIQIYIITQTLAVVWVRTVLFMFIFYWFILIFSSMVFDACVNLVFFLALFRSDRFLQLQQKSWRKRERKKNHVALFNKIVCVCMYWWIWFILN